MNSQNKIYYFIHVKLTNKNTSKIRNIITSLNLEEEFQKYDTPNDRLNKDTNPDKN